VILFSPAKINLGLQILRKRNDGFHDLSTLMYPLPFRDILEINPSTGSEAGFSMTRTGIPIPGETDENLCYRAWKLFCREHSDTPVRLHLHKRIPLGAGLGGGSSNAATVLKGLNTLKGDPFSVHELEEMAAVLGSDCSLFIKNKPALAAGRGEVLRETPVRLSGLYLVLLYPELHIDTATAYRNVIPDADRPPLHSLLELPLESWQEQVINDFEQPVFSKFPEIGELKSALSASGAVYASMSGSGSAVFGLFRDKPGPDVIPMQYIAWEGYL
jgi:4-diphosphocytidyl-2-C-methyl-D-erythritol kinase